MAELCDEGLAHASGDDARAARILALRTWARLFDLDIRAALQGARAALELAERTGDPHLLAVAISRLGQVETWHDARAYAGRTRAWSVSAGARSHVCRVSVWCAAKRCKRNGQGRPWGRRRRSSNSLARVSGQTKRGASSGGSAAGEPLMSHPPSTWGVVTGGGPRPAQASAECRGCGPDREHKRWDDRRKRLFDGDAGDVREWKADHWKISVVQSPPWRRTSCARAGPVGRS
jgi:hypothetical protein